MPSEATLYTQDGKWKIEVRAFKTYLFFYSSIGSEVRTFRKERFRRWYDPWYKHVHWRERAVDHISISNSYRGILPSQSPAAANRWAEGYNRSHLEEKIWVAGFGVSMDATADTGLPDPSTTTPGGAPKLDVREVHGRANVRIGGESFTAEVDAR